MPNGRIVVDILPSRHAREKCVHHHQLFRLCGKLSRVSVSNHQSDVVSHDSRLINPQGFHQRVNAGAGFLHVETIFWDRGVADSRQVGSDYSEPFGEQWKEWPPHARGFGVTMNQYDRWTFPRRQIVKLKA